MPLRIADMTAQDTGGQSFRLSRAVTDYTEHISRSFRRSADYLGFPSDITEEKLTRPSRRAFVTEFLASADVIHVHNMYRYANGWGPLNPAAKWLVHQHGRIPTAQRAAFLAADKERGALRVVSTLNLLPYVDNDPERWIPAPIRLSEYDNLPHPEHEGFLIAHSPTNREYKGTETFLEAVRTLQEEGLDVRAVLIENTPHADCIAIKAGCDAVYDQMHLCYGNSALEGMALGLPALVGMPDSVHEIVKQVVGLRPYVTVTPENLETQIAKLALNKQFYRKYAKRGRHYIETVHDDRLVAVKITRHYEVLCG